MICQNCGEREATFHFSKTINGEKSEVHLCSRCAEQQGTANLAFQAPSIHQLLASLIGSTSGSGAATAPARDPGAGSQPVCPGCGFSYGQFAHTGRMGCSRCYEAFADQLGPLLRKVHSATEHTGKAPRRAEGPLKLKREISALRRELQVAIGQEDFERAAQLRDRIRALERQAQEAAASPPASAPTDSPGKRSSPKGRGSRAREEGSQ